MSAFRALLILGLTFMPLSLSAETFLLMAEDDGCVWCARWNAEISEAYPKTAEGQSAPLKRFDMHVGPPDGISLKTPVRFTPTFILTKDGVEVDRLEGYPGAHFFWGVLGQMLDRADIPYEKSG